MGKVTNGVNGQVSGKVGSVVFCKWKGIDYIRGLPRFKRKKKATAGQAKQRSKFSTMQALLSYIIPVVRLGFMNTHPNRTGHNSAMSKNIQDALEENPEGGYRIIPEKFMCSQGILPPAKEASILQQGNEVIVNWRYDDGLDEDRKHWNDRAILLVYDFNEYGSHRLLGNSRSERTQKITLPAGAPKGTCLHAYLAFFAGNGSNHSSDSVYLGAITVA